MIINRTLRGGKSLQLRLRADDSLCAAMFHFTPRGRNEEIKTKKPDWTVLDVTDRRFIPSPSKFFFFLFQKGPPLSTGLLQAVSQMNVCNKSDPGPVFLVLPMYDMGHRPSLTPTQPAPPTSAGQCWLTVAARGVANVTRLTDGSGVLF